MVSRMESYGPAGTTVGRIENYGQQSGNISSPRTAFLFHYTCKYEWPGTDHHRKCFYLEV